MTEELDKKKNVIILKFSSFLDRQEKLLKQSHKDYYSARRKESLTGYLRHQRKLNITDNLLFIKIYIWLILLGLRISKI